MKPGSLNGSAVFCDDRYDRREVLYHPAAVADLLTTADCWPVTIGSDFTT